MEFECVWDRTVLDTYASLPTVLYELRTHTRAKVKVILIWSCCVYPYRNVTALIKCRCSWTLVYLVKVVEIFENFLFNDNNFRWFWKFSRFGEVFILKWRILTRMQNIEVCWNELKIYKNLVVSVFGKQINMGSIPAMGHLPYNCRCRAGVSWLLLWRTLKILGKWDDDFIWKSNLNNVNVLEE